MTAQSDQRDIKCVVRYTSIKSIPSTKMMVEAIQTTAKIRTCAASGGVIPMIACSHSSMELTRAVETTPNPTAVASAIIRTLKTRMPSIWRLTRERKAYAILGSLDQLPLHAPQS